LMRHERSAGIVVFHRHGDRIEYLILHYEENHWDLPKGHIEGDETKEQAAIRETHEEAGLHVDIIPGFEEEYKYFFTGRDKATISKTVYFFVGESGTKDVRLSHEHIGFRWLVLDEALKQLTYPNARKVVEAADRFIRGP
jgi:bis(5'-nucleosidyl)-tetraphosphatase